MVRVLVIDDGEVGRLGRAAALDLAGHRPTAVGWEEAGRIADRPRSTRFDLVLAGLRPDPTSWDRYRALGTLRALVDGMDASVDVVALVWGAAAVNPFLGLRLARAGVSRVVPACDAASSADLDAVVSDPRVGRCPVPDTFELALAGVGPDCDPDAVVAWVSERADDPKLGDAYQRAFDPAFAQNTCGLSRRKAHTLRVHLAAIARMLPAAARSAGGPERDLSLPRWSEVVAVANQCRGLETEDRTCDLLDSRSPRQRQLVWRN